MRESTTKEGNKITRYGVYETPAQNRYSFDFNGGKLFPWFGLPPEGWEQYDTDQDASYFGVWVNREALATVTYAEGDVCVVRCATGEEFTRELKSMADFYGDPPPAFVTIDDEGNATAHILPRPE